MTTAEVETEDRRSTWGIKGTLASVRDWLFGPYTRLQRAESFTPRRRPSECWCILWHRIGVRCTAHALGLEAYYRTYNVMKRDEWVPEIREEERDFSATHSEAAV